ncbi:unnamed protein product [Thelazia callipaeda]|uniref:Uncharacterized protein n=1 Tax=Thelazia callipaeda TaxID=103827 RepID=A0A0N5D2D8_THECL|nr:unnamed protein product [Thelazia callipaeda]
MSEKRDEYFPISEGHAVIAQRILKELLDTRSFQKYLIDSTVNEIFGDSVCVPVPLLELNSSRKCSKVESSVRRHLCIRKNVGILIQQLALIKDLFATSSNLAFCHVGANSNHDAALLFSTRLHLQRFINSFHFELQKFEQTIRRFDTLFRLFAIRLST